MASKKSIHPKISESLSPITERSLSKQCAAKVMETIPLVMRFIRADLRDRKATELSVPQFRTLAFLDRNPGASLVQLSEHLGVTCATASANTQRLVERNFVDRCDHPSERRRVSLKLTTDGKEHLDKTRDLTRSYLADLLDSLSEEQIVKIDDSLGLLYQVFESKSTA
jgi:DNA-binding MarR family transcriptional regulator